MSIRDFKDIPTIFVDEKTWNEYSKYKFVDCDDPQYDDPKYNWKIVCKKCNDEKYGRTAISEKYKIRRALTMGEFYGTGIVD